MKRPTILSIGNVNIDKYNLFGAEVPLPGGGALNVAVAASRMGAHSKLLGAVGKEDGDFIRNILQQHGVEAYLQEFPGKTGSIDIIFESKNGRIDRRFENFEPGANNCLGTNISGWQKIHGYLKDVDCVVISGWVLFGDTKQVDFVNHLLDDSIPTRRIDCAIDYADSSIVSGHRPRMRDLAGKTRIIKMNEDEFLTYINERIKPPNIAGYKRLMEDRLQPMKRAKDNPEITFLTLGNMGSLALSPVYENGEPTSEYQIHECKAGEVHVVDPNGAGDASFGTLLSLMYSGYSIPEAMKASSYVSGRVVGSYGSIEGMPIKGEVLDFLR